MREKKKKAAVNNKNSPSCDAAVQCPAGISFHRLALGPHFHQVLLERAPFSTR
jgi:hypothetical protein